MSKDYSPDIKVLEVITSIADASPALLDHLATKSSKYSLALLKRCGKHLKIITSLNKRQLLDAIQIKARTPDIVIRKSSFLGIRKNTILEQDPQDQQPNKRVKSIPKYESFCREGSYVEFDCDQSDAVSAISEPSVFTSKYRSSTTTETTLESPAVYDTIESMLVEYNRFSKKCEEEECQLLKLIAEGVDSRVALIIRRRLIESRLEKENMLRKLTEQARQILS